MRLAGLEPVSIGQASLFVNIGERTNVTGSKAFARMILEGRYEDAGLTLSPISFYDGLSRAGVDPPMRLSIESRNGVSP